MRTRPERLTAYSAFAALALGASGTLFERAGPSVLSAGPAEFLSWARAHHDALVAQSVIFGLSTAPLLLFFAGLRAALQQEDVPADSGRVDLTLLVLGGGAAWVMAQLLGQAVQVAMASAAVHGEHASFVASLGALMRTVLAWGNAPLALALAGCAVTSFRRKALPGWVAALSGVAGLVHLLPLGTARVRKGPLSQDGALAYLPYPVFVGWMLSVAVSLLRKAPPPTTFGPGRSLLHVGRWPHEPHRRRPARQEPLRLLP
jgi:hypothetical protein